MLEKINVNKQKILLISIYVFIIIAMLVIIGYTYSFFQYEAVNDSVITGTAASLDFTVGVEKVAPNSTRKMVPQLDDYITKAVTGRTGNCLDDNSNVVCQVYKITVKNKNDIASYIDGKLEITKGNNSNLRWAEISGTSSPSLVSSVNSTDVTELKTNILLPSNGTLTYYIVIWISETGSAQTDNGNFTGVVTFGTAGTLASGTNSSTGGSGSPSSTLASLGLSVSSGTPRFNKTSCSSGCEEATVGIYEAEDDLGTSYYFRGDVTNNYVKFGKNSSGSDMYWRIIRINGDGTVRMIYDGTSAHANGESSTDRQVGTSAFNSTKNDNTYVGYMYGTAGATTYDATHSNSTDSTMKIYLEGDGTTSNEGWYKDNIIDTGYGSYVADAIYCNDRSLSTASSSYTGIGTNMNYYAAYQRNYDDYDNRRPSLKCTNNADKFTTNTSLGNGKNKYPVGLITADEVELAGGKYGTGNSKYYLHTGNYFWTMSPYLFNGSNAGVFNVDSSVGYSNYRIVNNTGGVRPVVSLRSNVLQYGQGTTSDPFRISQ